MVHWGSYTGGSCGLKKAFNGITYFESSVLVGSLAIWIEKGESGVQIGRGKIFIGMKERKKGETETERDKEQVNVTRYNSLRTVSNLQPWVNLPNNTSRTTQRRHISTSLKYVAVSGQ